MKKCYTSLPTIFTYLKCNSLTPISEDLQKKTMNMKNVTPKTAARLATGMGRTTKVQVGARDSSFTSGGKGRENRIQIVFSWGKNNSQSIKE